MKNDSKILKGCIKSDSGILKGCITHHSRLLQGSFMDVSRMLQGYITYASKILQRCFNNAKGSIIMCHGFPPDISRSFHDTSSCKGWEVWSYRILGIQGTKTPGLISVSYLFKLIVTILYLSINNFCLPNQITVPPLTIITIMVGCDFAIQLYSYSVPPENIDPFESTGSRMDWKMFLVAEQLYTHPCVSVSGSVCMFPILCKKIIGFKYT